MSNLEPLVKIGEWYYQAAYGQLLPVAPELTNTSPLILEPRLQGLLNYFLLHPNQVIDKDRLIDDVWPAEEGTDAAVMRAVGALRKVLGDNAKAPSYIATIAKKGYCWLCEIEPLTSNQSQGVAKVKFTVADSSKVSEAVFTKVRPGQFLGLVILALVLGGALAAYILASVTVTPLTRLPDTIKPLSAISGQEFWPSIAPDQQQAFYTYRKSEAATVQLARQDLSSLKVSYSAEQFSDISQPLWLADNQLLFRAADLQQNCYFYQQQVLPDFEPATRVLSCNQVIPQGLAVIKQHWFWLDYAADFQRFELWQRDKDGNTARVMVFPQQWRNVDQLIVSGSVLYVMAQHDYYQSHLYLVDLDQQQLESVSGFSKQVIATSRWDEGHFLLTLKNDALQLLALANNKRLSLGPLTWNLLQPQRYQERILATQHLDYTTDIVQLKLADQQLLVQDSRHVSNRNERLFAENGQSIAFVSERAGDNQIWLAHSGESRQLSRLQAGQYIQQLFWHKNVLMSVIDNQLYQINLADGSLKDLHSKPVSGRYQSCHNNLYWTEQTADGWQLMLMKAQQPESLLSGVVNLKCAPEGLVVQFYNDSTLALWSMSRPELLTPLPAQLNWHQLLPEQWTSNQQHLLWLDKQHWQLKTYHWQNGQTTSYQWPASTLPLEIYSGNATTLFSVQPRHYDTDIVWLQNRN